MKKEDTTMAIRVGRWFLLVNVIAMLVVSAGCSESPTTPKAGKANHSSYVLGTN